MFLGLNQIYLLYSTSYIKMSHIIAFLLIETTTVDNIVSQIQNSRSLLLERIFLGWTTATIFSCLYFTVNLILVTLRFLVKPKSYYFCITYYGFSFFYLFPCIYVIDFGLNMVSNIKGIFNNYIKQRDKYYAWSIL